ncbi:MAG: Nif3-like dinuclear metal center hexameric protein, partial [Phycisphaerales bacterium]
MKTRPRLAPPTPEEVEAALDRLSPFRLAEAWDNVGVLLATSRKSLGRILLTIDLTERVLDEAIAKRADGIVAYHPPIFAPLKRLADRDRVERTIRRAAAEN